MFYCLTAFRPERTAAFRALLAATDHNGYNAKSNLKLADAIRNLGAVSGVVVLCVKISRRSLRCWGVVRGMPRFTAAFVIDFFIQRAVFD